MTLLRYILPLATAHAINSLLLGVAIAALAAIILKTVARHNSAARFAALYSALLAIVGMFFWIGGPHRANVSQQASAITVSGEWAAYIFYAWGIVALIGNIRIAAGLLHLCRLRHGFLPYESSELSEIIENRLLNSKRTVKFYISEKVRVPTAIGFLRPAVVLPTWAVKELSPEEMRTAVLHELAHVDRWDDWTNLLQKIIRALLFFHPAVWWIDRRLSIEREISCDDAVLLQTSNPERYASCLVSLAEKSFLRRPLALAQGAVGRVKQTALRIAKILDGRQRKTVPAWRVGLATVSVFSIFGFVAVGHTPELIAFSSPTAPVTTASAPNLDPVTPVARRVAQLSATAKPVKFAAHDSGSRQGTNSRRTPMPAAEFAAKTSLKTANRSKVINAAATETESPQVMYLIFQSREYDGAGGVRVTTSVWRVRLVSTHAGTGAVPHST